MSVSGNCDVISVSGNCPEGEMERKLSRRRNGEEIHTKYTCCDYLRPSLLGVGELVCSSLIGHSIHNHDVMEAKHGRVSSGLSSGLYCQAALLYKRPNTSVMRHHQSQ